MHSFALCALNLAAIRTTIGCVAQRILPVSTSGGLGGCAWVVWVWCRQRSVVPLMGWCSGLWQPAVQETRRRQACAHAHTCRRSFCIVGPVSTGSPGANRVSCGPSAQASNCHVACCGPSIQQKKGWYGKDVSSKHFSRKHTSTPSNPRALATRRKTVPLAVPSDVGYDAIGVAGTRAG